MLEDLRGELRAACADNEPITAIVGAAAPVSTADTAQVVSVAREASFVGYEKMPHSSAAFKDIGRSHSEQFVVTEKIHGAHFAIVVDRISSSAVAEAEAEAKPFLHLRARFAKRSTVLGDGEDFYGVRAFDKGNLAKNLAAGARRVFATFEARLAAATAARHGEESLLQVAVHGELFGGHYPAAPPSPPLSTTAANAVQTGVWYTDRLAFMAFDVAVQVQTKDVSPAEATVERYYLDYCDAREMCAACGLLFAAPLLTGSFEACLALDVDSLVTTLPARLGMAANLHGNYAEGVVVKRLLELPRSQHPPRLHHRFVLKRKAVRFSEKAYDMSTKPAVSASGGRGQAVGGGHLGALGDLTVQLLRWELEASITPARLEAVMSKDGRPDWLDSAACRKLLRALVADAVGDLEPSDKELFQGLTGEDRALILQPVRDLAKAAIAAYSARVQNRSTQLCEDKKHDR